MPHKAKNNSRKSKWVWGIRNLFLSDSPRVPGFGHHKSGFALKHFLADSPRVPGFGHHKSGFALKHFYAQKGMYLA
jgi:hypothetical protein